MRQNIVACYTREPQEEAVYSRKLADSMHLALRTPEGQTVELNHNSGVLFAKATQNPDGTLNAKNMKNPWLAELEDGSFAVVAIRTDGDGGDDEESRGSILIFTSKDLLQYEEQGLIALEEDAYIEDVALQYDRECQQYLLWWKTDRGDCFQAEAIRKEGFEKRAVTEQEFAAFKEAGKAIAADITDSLEGAVLRNAIPVSDEAASFLRNRLTVPEHIRTELQGQVLVGSEEELDRVGATAWYSDGSCAQKKVDWDAEGIDWTKPGSYRISGRVHQDHYEFPIAFNRADPCIGRWKGKYYFIATNDADNNQTLFIRRADSIPGLVTAQEVKILDSQTHPHIGNLLWAPEFHVVKDRLYLFFAGTPQHFEDEHSHVMALREGGDPTKASDWETPVRVVRKDGSPLFDKGITLDMTCFEINRSYYVIWAQRQFEPVDSGSWLYIARVEADRPWRLTTDPVLISMPEYGWANNHTFVDEGPFALITKDKVFVTFSSAAVDTTYVVGLLSADPQADLLNPASWTKCNYPILTSRSVPGQYGTGHNAYVVDEDGAVWNIYHGRPGLEGPRSSGIRRVHFGIDGNPILDMTEEKDLKPEMAEVFLDVIVYQFSTDDEQP